MAVHDSEGEAEESRQRVKKKNVSIVVKRRLQPGGDAEEDVYENKFPPSSKAKGNTKKPAEDSAISRMAASVSTALAAADNCNTWWAKCFVEKISRMPPALADRFKHACDGMALDALDGKWPA